MTIVPDDAPAPRPRHPQPSYRRQDLGSLPAMMAFADDLAALRHTLGMCGEKWGNPIGIDAEADAFLALLDALEEGREPIDAVITAVRVWRETRGREDEAGEAARRRQQAAYEETMRQEEISRKVECPACGAVPGKSCRTTGEFRNVRTHSHRDRWRLARSLNDGAHEDAAAETVRIPLMGRYK